MATARPSPDLWAIIHYVSDIKKVLCYCTKFQENINPDKEETTLKKNLWLTLTPLQFLQQSTVYLCLDSHKEC